MWLEVAAALALSWDANPAGERVVSYRVTAEPVPENFVELPGAPLVFETEATALQVAVPAGEYLVSVQAINVLGWVSEPTDPPLSLVVEPVERPPAARRLRAWVVIEESRDLQGWTVRERVPVEITVPVEGKRFFRARVDGLRIDDGSDR